MSGGTLPTRSARGNKADSVASPALRNGDSTELQRLREGPTVMGWSSTARTAPEADEMEISDKRSAEAMTGEMTVRIGMANEMTAGKTIAGGMTAGLTMTCEVTVGAGDHGHGLRRGDIGGVEVLGETIAIKIGTRMGDEGMEAIIDRGDEGEIPKLAQDVYSYASKASR